jgi:hypothetical protein
MRHLRTLTVDELNKLNTKRLLGVLASVRAVEQSIIHRNLSYHWCCEVCKEYIGDGFKRDCLDPALHLTNYKNRIKKILATRENI